MRRPGPDIIVGTLLSLALLASFASGFLLLGSRSAVDWTEVRAVAFESDDWGLCGFVPAADALDGVDVVALEAGRFPGIYLGSTLESGNDVRRLAALMGEQRGRDGLSAVFQPNYIMASRTYVGGGNATDDSAWNTRFLPDLPELYARADLWPAVAAAIDEGVWRPEYHGLWHYDPSIRAAGIAANSEADRVARRGVLLFPGGSRAYELGLDRDTELLGAELSQGLDVFTRLFGRAPASIIAPDYAWDRRCELLWRDAGIVAIQGKREQRAPHKTAVSLWDRLLKVCERSWLRLTERRLTYLERNCRLEAAQVKDPVAHADRCIDAVRGAWDRGEPAIVETHRVNYAHISPHSLETGLTALSQLLAGLRAIDGPAPYYLTDSEIAQLARRGTCVRKFANVIVLRNMTHSRRPVILDGDVPVGGRIVWLEPRSTLLMKNHVGNISTN